MAIWQGLESVLVVPTVGGGEKMGSSGHLASNLEAKMLLNTLQRRGEPPTIRMSGFRIAMVPMWENP